MPAHAQSTKKQKNSVAKERKRVSDSVSTARQNTIESARKERQRVMDSTKAARLKVTDSIKLVRQHRADSLDAIRKYKESRRYRDSVERIRTARLDSIKTERQQALDSTRLARNHYFDSVKTERKRVSDSTIAARKVVTDSMKAIQKRRSDSMATIRAYRESPRYKDSVLVVRTKRLDSIKADRKAFNDSLAAVRRAYNDSITTARKTYNDSVVAVRTQYLDSVKDVRKKYADSMAVVKEKREKDKKARQKLKEEKQQLAFELKIKKKREAWSNEKMLKKKWSLPRQAIQNTFTRYNYYFNTDRKMDEALDNMKRVRKDNYDSMLTLYPFDPDRDSAALAADMDSIIQKTSIGIQIHDPRTKWGDDLYLLLGQAYYYKGDYKNAAIAFRYVISLRDLNKKKKPANTSGTGKKEQKSLVEEDDKSMLDFLKHRTVHNEAILWLARTYTEAHNHDMAESVIDLLETDPKMPENLRGRLALEKAYLYLDRKNEKAAIPQLAIVAADNNLPNWVRQRAAFINGQLQQDDGDYTASAQSFKQVIELMPEIEMDFYARKNLAYSQMMGGGDQQEAIASLKKVLKDGKYLPYYEQVYFVLGRLAANSGDNEEAVEYLQQSLASTKSTKKQKAQSFASLGNVYYRMANYVPAKQAYDSAAIMAANAPGDTLLAVAVRRSQALGYITGPAKTIHDQDSLLALSAMSEKEQRANARRYIRALQQARQDSIFRAENAGLNAALQNVSAEQAIANWYFANPTLMQQGTNEFKRKWGNRPLQDNWRRMSAIGFAGQNNKNNQQQSEENPDIDEEGLPTEDALIAGIPRTQKEQDDARRLIRRAYVDLGTAYIKQLEDYPRAKVSLDTLDTRFAQHEHQAEVLYLRYLMALRQNQLPEAQTYSQRLLQEHSTSRWAQLVRPTEDGGPVSTTDVPVSVFYDETYGQLIQRQYPIVLQRSREGQSRYNDQVYQNRFKIMEAISLAGLGNYQQADTLVRQYMIANPAGNDSLRIWAESILNYINAQKKLTAANDTGAKKQAVVPAAVQTQKTAPVPPPAPVTEVTTVTAPENAPESFKYDAKAEHMVIFSFGKVESRTMGVKSAIADFNKFKFGSLGLSSDIEQMNETQGFVVVRKFSNAAQAKIYLGTLKKTEQVFRDYKSNEYQLFLISTANYAKMLKDGSIEPYMEFYRTSYR